MSQIETRINIWADGATVRANPGMITWGVCAETDRWTIRFCGRSGYGTSCQAELIAIKKATLFLAKLRLTGVTVYTDSSYCIRVLTKACSANKNQDLVRDTIALLDMTQTRLEKVRGVFNKGHEPAQTCKEVI